MQPDNKTQREHLRPRDPDEHELHRLVSGVAASAGLGDVLRPVEPGAEVLQHLTRVTSVVPREPGDSELRQLHASAGSAMSSKVSAATERDPQRPRDPVDAEVHALLKSAVGGEGSSS